MSKTDPGTSMTLLGRLREPQVDQDAWARLVRLYGPLIGYWAGRRRVAGADAEDVAQEVFQAVAAGLADFRRDRPGDSFRGWLHGITGFVLLRHADRAAGREGAVGGTLALENIQNLPAAAHDDEVNPPAEVSALYRRGLELVRGEFEARTWRAFWEHVVDGRSPADVAADLGVSSAAVRQAKSRVLRRLREELGDLID